MEDQIPDFLKEKDILGLDKPFVPLMYDPELHEIIPEEPIHVYAGLGIRIIAYILDALILFVPLFIFEIAVFGPESSSAEHAWGRNLLNLIIWMLYYGLMESSESQATFGKKICGLIVIDEEGNRLTFKKASLRYLAMMVSFLPFGIGIIVIAFSVKKQAWHDSWLGCYVIKAKPVQEDTASD